MPPSLPKNPSVRFLQTEAKRILKSHRNRDPDICATFKLLERFKHSTDQEILKPRITLQATQFALALSYGFKGWNQLIEHVRSMRSHQLTLSEPSAPNETMVKTLRDEGFNSPIVSVQQIQNPHGINDVYLVEYEGGKAVLRVWKLSSPPQAIAQLKALQRLEECSFPSPRRLFPRSPDRILTVAGRPAAVFEFIQGRHPPTNTVRPKFSESDIELSAQIGALIARAHVALTGLATLDHRVHSYSHYLHERVRTARTLDIDATTGDRLEHILDTITKEEQELSDSKQLPIGLIHDDAGPWNVLLRNGSVAALLDSESIHEDLPVYDIAHVIGQWGSCSGNTGYFGFDTDAVRAIVGAYASVRPLSAIEREALARAVPLRHAIQLLVPLVDVLDLPDWNFGEYLDRFELMTLRDDPGWLDLFMGIT